MKKFIHEAFMLDTALAVQLYNDYAKDLPIIDYHCHLEAKEIFEDKQYENIVDVLLGEDHYKWKLLRASGVRETYITGLASPREKFRAFTGVLAHSIGNVIHHWTHLEYQRFFAVDVISKADNADALYDQLNAQMRLKRLSPQAILAQCNVALIGTTDDPLADLSYHQKLAKQGGKTRVIPTFRADSLFTSNKNWGEYVENLGKVVGFEITSLALFERAITQRIEYFIAHGCCSIDIGLAALPQQYEDAAKFFLATDNTTCENESLNAHILTFLLKKSHTHNLVVQLHLGPLRNINTTESAKIGINSGFDMINNPIDITVLITLFNQLEAENKLPKTIIYNLNKADNHIIDCFMGTFCGRSKGKIQHGTPWWFNDHLDGFLEHFNSYKQATSFYNFLGMTTDSRSFLSMSRHEYYRRIVCNFIANEVVHGRFPQDDDLLKDIVEAVCYKNALNYFTEGKKTNITSYER
ncbi:MAG: glucuronate isomerase [Culicoidibacterales bacterium]